MQTIRPEFHKNAWQLSRGAAAGSNSDSDAESIGSLTLEMVQSPFADFMKKIDRLLDTGLTEDLLQAYNMARSALADRIFDDGQQLKIMEKLDNIIDIVHAERILGNAFTKSVHDIQIQAPEHTQPAPAPSALFKLAA